MRVLVAAAPVLILAAAAVFLPSCSDDPAATPADGDAGTGDGSTPDAVSPLVDAAPDGPTASLEYRGGTRLRPVVTTGGGAKLFSRFHDSMLDVDCTYETLLDGARHCAPTSTQPGRVYFLDATCTQKILGWPASCAPTTPAKYAEYTNYDIACSAPEVLELGVASAPATTYEKQNGTCAAYAGPALTYRSVTRTVAPSELVTGTVAREPRGKQLFATYIDGSDGSRQPFAIEDSAPHAGRCDEMKMSDSSMRCAPTKLAFIEGLFGEATCTTEAAYEPGYTADCILPPVAILASLQGTCSGFYAAKYFEVGAKLAGPVYQGSPASCTVYPGLAAESRFYGKGAAIADTAFAALKHVHGSGTPLDIDSLAVETGETLHASSFWDPAHAFACAASKASDGKTRCASRQADVLDFADAACAQPLATVDHTNAGCAAAVAPAYVSLSVPTADLCGPASLRLWRVGAKVSPAQVYGGSSCTGHPPSAGVDYYATTTEVPAAELVELTELTE